MNVSDLKSVKLMLNGKADFIVAKQRKRLLNNGDILHFYYQHHPGKCCENCITQYLDVEYSDVPVNCPHAGICKHFTNFIGSTKITGISPVTDILYRFRFNKIIQLDRHIEVEQEGTHGIRLTKE